MGVVVLFRVMFMFLTRSMSESPSGEEDLVPRLRPSSGAFWVDGWPV